MKLTPLFVLLFFIISLNYIHAQNNSNTNFTEKKGSINGKIIDKTTKEPMPYVNIVVKESNKTVTGGITSEKGTFAIKNLEFKNYAVEIQFIGYKTILKNVILSQENSSIDLKTIALEVNAIELKGVEIIREKSTIEQKIDRKIINVGKDLVAAGATAGEIMNNIPSVSIDPQTNEISLRGNDNVKILIDGKPTNIEASQLLKQIPSSSIKQIELITNPSAKYNPEGMSGMINIVLNKNTKVGFNGNISNGITIGITPKMNSSFDLNYRSGKFNFFTNYGFNHGINATRGQINNNDIGRENIQKVDLRNKSTSHLVKLGFDYYINDTNTFSFYTNQNFYKANVKSDVRVDFISNIDILQRFNNLEDNHSQTYNFDYKHKFKKEGHNIELEVNYNENKEPEFAVFTTTNLDTNSLVSSDINDINNFGENSIINLDYVNPLTETIKLELGLENRQENTSNDFFLNNSSNSDFKYNRDIHSAYANIGKQLKKWSFQTGVRLEKYKVEPVGCNYLK